MDVGDLGTNSLWSLRHLVKPEWIVDETCRLSLLVGGPHDDSDEDSPSLVEFRPVAHAV